MRTKPKFEINKRLHDTALYFFIILLVSVSVVVYQNALTSRSQQQIYTILRDLSSEKSLTLKTKLDGRYVLLESFAASLAREEIHNDARLLGRMTAVFDETDFIYVGVIWADGTIVMHDGKQLSASDRQYFKESMQGRSCLEWVPHDKIDKMPRFVITVPIMRAGVPVGAVMAGYDETSFAGLCKPRSFNNNAYALICDDSGNVLVNEKNENSLLHDDNIWEFLETARVISPKWSLSQIKENLHNSREGMLLYSSGNESRIAAYVPIDIATTKWVMITCVPKSVVDEWAHDNMHLTWALITIIFIGVAGMLLLFIRSERMTSKEITKRNAKLMMSQIKPHFLYNTLGAIETMIFSNPEKASDLLIDFSKYLRTNINFLSDDGLVSFEKEMQHVRVYLDIEKARFGDRINVRYDLQEENFMLPPLSVQPVVENAIKHGICKRAEGGTVEISTRRENRKYIITVRDNGVGFDIHQPANGLSVGSKNIEFRLKTMVGGTIHAKSEPGVGTTVTMTIPERRNKRI